VILLDDVVQVAHRPASTSLSEFSDLLEFSLDLRIRRIPIHVDHPWTWVAAFGVERSHSMKFGINFRRQEQFAFFNPNI